MLQKQPSPIRLHLEIHHLPRVAGDSISNEERKDEKESALDGRQRLEAMWNARRQAQAEDDLLDHILEMGYVYSSSYQHQDAVEAWVAYEKAAKAARPTSITHIEVDLDPGTRWADLCRWARATLGCDMRTLWIPGKDRWFLPSSMSDTRRIKSLFPHARCLRRHMSVLTC